MSTQRITPAQHAALRALHGWTFSGRSAGATARAMGTFHPANTARVLDRLVVMGLAETWDTAKGVRRWCLSPAGEQFIVDTRAAQTPPAPTPPVLADCQIYDSRVKLPCSATDSGGVRCTRTDVHGKDHEIDAHTIAHALAGNGYPCRMIAVERTPSR
ncbi:MarR family winged helix-turn-helix transcriptional regulator [Oerskovia enterophila]|uniref:MarR family protein n=1 Tax=Oerskovia enterophila TaxID=43678 RepID=A0ABX2Y8G7_9CELL|nr:MarR family winged helix-turn-helix transcriptional regulator [Oerskovia enterophila]OCI32905.1 hypothetical protein OERS_04970 [Oerskovia enterophila]